MTGHLTIIGSGYTGTRLAWEARDRGWGVAGTTRSEETAAALREVGARALEWHADGTGEEELASTLERSDSVVYSVPTLYSDYESPDGPIRHVEPVHRALGFAIEGGVERFVYLSSTSVYGNHDGEWVDEETATNPSSPNGKMRRDIEEHVLSRGDELNTYVARLVGIYGPGRTMLDYVASGRYKLVDGGTKPTNRVHVDDIVGSILAVIDRAPSGSRLYNVSDGNPKTVAEVVDWLVEHQGIERPSEVSLEEYRRERGENAAARWENTYRVSNQRLVEELGVEFEYSDVFEGYEAIFGE